MLFIGKTLVTRILSCALLSFACSTALAASDSFLGSTVTGTLYDPNLSTILGGPTTEIVGSGTTFPAGSIVGDTAFQIDITSDQIVYDPLSTATYGTGTFNGFVFQFSGAPQIKSVTVDGSSTFSPTAFSFTGDTVSLDLAGLSVTNTSQTVLDVEFVTSAVPEPGTWILALVCTCVLPAVARRRGLEVS